MSAGGRSVRLGPRIVRILRGGGWEVAVRLTTPGDDPAALAARVGPDTVVAARGGDLQGVAGLGLPDDVGQVEDAVALRAGLRGAGLLAAPAGPLDDGAGARRQGAAVVLDELANVVDRAHSRPGDEGGLAGGGGGHDDVGHAGLHGRAHGGQDAAHGVDGAVQAELADVDGPPQEPGGAPSEPPACSQDGQGERQVQPGPGLAQVSWGEVDGQALLAPGDAAGAQRGPHALARLAHGGVG